MAVATQNYVYKTGFRLSVTWLDQLRYPAVEYLFWAVAAPFIYGLALRYRKPAQLLAWALLIDVLHAIYRGSLHSLVYPPRLVPEMPAVPWLELVKYYALGNLFGALWLFAVIAGRRTWSTSIFVTGARTEWSAGACRHWKRSCIRTSSSTR